MILDEASRNELIRKSKQSPKGLQRYKRRNKSRVANSVKEFNSIDMNRLFKDGILSVNINVSGETNNYIVRISFGGFLEILHDELKRNNDKLDLRVIIRTLLTGFNRDDVYINCTCPDFIYRYSYYATKNDYDTYAKDNKKVRNPKLGLVDPQNIPSKITNPYDKLGSSCKHVLLVLSNNSWLMKVASVINNYIKYMEKNYQKAYADVIFPAIYQRPYDKDIQMTMFDTNRKYVKTGKDTLGRAIDQGTSDRDEKGRFLKSQNTAVDNTAEDEVDINQISLFDEE